MLEDTKIIVQCVDTLGTIIGDVSVPKNIRRSAENMRKILSNEKEPLLERTAKVISELENVGNERNIPFHTRTIVWGLSSQLESISVGKESEIR
jgi:uncharacterized protein (UPF0147 family)